MSDFLVNICVAIRKYNCYYSCKDHLGWVVRIASENVTWAPSVTAAAAEYLTAGVKGHFLKMKRKSLPSAWDKLKRNRDELDYV